MSAVRLAYCQTLVCSFCGKPAAEVEKLIAGPTVFICDECVSLCQDLLNEIDDESERPVFTAAQDARAAAIARGIVAEVLQGTDARISDAIASTLDGRSSSVEVQSISPEGPTVRFYPGEVSVAPPVSDVPCHD